MLERIEILERKIKWIYCNLVQDVSSSIKSIRAGTNVSIDSIDPDNPIINVTIPKHNELVGLQGGNESDEFYHLDKETFDRLKNGIGLSIGTWDFDEVPIPPNPTLTIIDLTN